MSDHHDKHHHHHDEEKHHHKEEEHQHKEEKHRRGEEYSQGPYGSQPPSSAYGGGYSQSGAPAAYPPQYASSTAATTATTAPHDSKAEAEERAALEKSQKRNEHLAEFGALASGAFAMYEQHKAKTDPENAQRHRIEETVAGVTALGTGGFAVYEHHQVTTAHKVDAASNPDEKKHHGFFKK